MPESGTLQSITIYHEGGTGNVLLGVYDDSASPGSRLGVTASTAINAGAGWQTIDLISPVNVSSGQTIWLAWVFENNPGIRYTTGTPGRASSSQTWSGGMPDPFGSATVANYIYSIYATYTPVAQQTVGYTDVFANTTIVGNRRAQPVVMPEAGSLESISIYHEGRIEDVLPAAYEDNGDLPRSLRAILGFGARQVVLDERPLFRFGLLVRRIRLAALR